MKLKLFSLTVAFIISFFLYQDCLAIDQLEEAYKEQYEKWTAEIENLQKRIKSNEEAAAKYISLHDQNCVPYRAYMSDICRSYLNTGKIFAKQLDEDRPRLMELEDKKQELKIKILETKGTLPEWWTK